MPTPETISDGLDAVRAAMPDNPALADALQLLIRAQANSLAGSLNAILALMQQQADRAEACHAELLNRIHSADNLAQAAIFALSEIGTLLDRLEAVEQAVEPSVLAATIRRIITERPRRLRVKTP